jgi:hypothetical protein
MGATRELQAHSGPTDGWAKVNALTDGPVFAGDGGLDWTCSGCATVLVTGAVSDRQFLDLLFGCRVCGAVSSSPGREPGDPLAGQLMVLRDERNVRTVDIAGRPVMVVGQRAFDDAYMREIGAPGAVPPAEESGRRDFSIAGLRAMASDAERLLGSRAVGLIAKDERGRKAKTPPRRRHRVVELWTYTREVADEMDRSDKPPGALAVDKFSELTTMLTMFDRWRHHPAYSALIASLADGIEVQHTVMLLVVASFLADAGNGVGLVTGKAAGGRIADLWIEPTLLERLDIELKTPLVLRGPRATPLMVEDATSIIAERIDKVAASRLGQLDVEQSGILAIGGFHLGAGGLDILEAGATAALARRASSKSHLAALTVSQLGGHITDEVDVHGNVFARRLQPALETRVVRHPGYGGELSIHERAASRATFFPERTKTADQLTRVPMNRAERRRAERQARHRRA